MRVLRNMGRGVREMQVRKEILNKMKEVVSQPTTENIKVV